MDDNRPIYNERCEVETDPVEQVRLLRKTLNSWRFQYNGRVYTDQELGAELAALDAARADVARLREIERYARQVAGHFGDGANNCPTCLTPRGHRDDCPYEHLWRLLAATAAQP